LAHTMSSSSPETKPAQPKDTQDPSGAKDLVVSDSEQEKQAVKDVNASGTTAKVEFEASAPVTKSQDPPPPVLSEKPPLSPSDSAPGTTTPDPENGQDPTVPTTTAPAGAPALPDLGVTDAQVRERALKRKKLDVIHTRLARLFTWILLLAFVILPGAYSKGGSNIPHIGLFAAGYICCSINAFAVGCLWYVRKDDPEWVFTHLFFSGLTYAFSGLISTVVSVASVQSVSQGTATTSNIVLSSVCTFIYGVLSAIYARKRSRARQRERRRASSATV